MKCKAILQNALHFNILNFIDLEINIHNYSDLQLYENFNEPI